jgi:nitrogen regulatory protein PII
MNCQQKMIQIITSNTLESRVKKIFRKLGIKSFTFYTVNGEGDSGLQSGHFDADSNVLFMLMLPEDLMPALLIELNHDIKKGYHHFVFSMNAELHSCNNSK